MPIAALHMSPYGPKRTRRSATAAAAFGGKADIALGSPIPAYLKKPAPQKMLRMTGGFLKRFFNTGCRAVRRAALPKPGCVPQTRNARRQGDPPLRATASLLSALRSPPLHVLPHVVPLIHLPVKLHDRSLRYSNRQPLPQLPTYLPNKLVQRLRPQQLLNKQYNLGVRLYVLTVKPIGLTVSMARILKKIWSA